MSEYVKCGTNEMIRRGRNLGDIPAGTKSAIGLGIVAYALYAMFFAKGK